MNIVRKIFFSIVSLISLVSIFSCNKVEEPDYREKDYGYVQFKLYKKASYQVKSETSIEYLRDISKVCVYFESSEGYEFSQTLVLNSSSEVSAEFGLRSDKLKLIAGTYRITQYDLYGNMDQLVASCITDQDAETLEICAGGLVVYDLTADVIERGSVKFSLIKDLSAVMPTTRAASGNKAYTFDEIAYVTIALKNSDIEFKMLPTDFSIHFDESKKPDPEQDAGWQTSSFECDTLVYLKAGTYEIGSYTLYDDSKKELEINNEVVLEPFEVRDNETAEVKVPVKLQQNAYIMDYIALKEIYDSLTLRADGTREEWYYRGDEWPVGSTWNFDKDVDLWGAQPGVKLFDDGRVALLSLSGFGAKGKIPAALGRLTALEELYLGNHNEENFLDKDPTVQPGMSSSNRMQRHKEYLKRTKVLTQFSEAIARGMKEKGVSVPEIALYDTMSEKEILDNQGRMRIRPMADALPGAKSNGISRIPKEIENLQNLKTLFIANGDIKEIPEELANCGELTDLEIYNCYEMKKFPTVISRLPKLTSANLSANPQWEDVDAGLVELASGPSAKSLQILYMNECSLTKLPAELNNMPKLGLLSVASNKIKEIESAYPDVSFVQLYLDDNEIENIPSTKDEKTGKNIFFRIEDVETFSCTYNKLKKVPDIFHADAIYGIASIDFSYNDIDGFENDGNGYQGVFVNTLSVANNPKLESYPKCLATSNSKVSNINLRGCGIKEIPKGSFKGENLKYLTSLDLSYNKLKDFPSEFTAVSCPYFFGIDLSFNQLSEFPWEPLDCAGLTTMAVRGQRNERGQRCLSEWPQGIYNHTGLRALYMGSNDLRKIDDTISYLIYILDISDNPNIVFDATDICYNWASGTYMLYYDKTQKILNCDAMLQ